MIIDMGGVAGRGGKALVISPSGSVTQKNTTASPARVVSASGIIGEDTEESVSAIQSFINETSTPVHKTPSPSVRITSTATGVVNIKAVSEPTSQVIRQIPTTTPRGRGRPPKIQQTTSTPISADAVVGSVRNMKGVSMVTLL